MENEKLSQLESLIEGRSKREQVLGGEYFAFMGILLMAIMAFNFWIYSHWWIWLVGMLSGSALIFCYDAFRSRKQGQYETRVQKEVSYLWLFVSCVIAPLIVVVFPFIFKLYSGRAIYPLIYLILGLSMLFTGLIAKSKEFKFGAIPFILSTFAFQLTQTTPQQVMLFFVAIFLGFVVPGFISKYNEKQ